MTETTKWYIVSLSGFNQTIKWYKKVSQILVVVSGFTQTIKYYMKKNCIFKWFQTKSWDHMVETSFFYNPWSILGSQYIVSK